MSSTPGKSSSNSTILQQTLSFLNNASFAISPQSPHVSAHLSREISDITNDLPSTARPIVGPSHKFQVCEGCGSIAIPGETSTRFTVDDGSHPLFKIGKGHEKSHLKRSNEKSVRVKCLVCGNMNKQKVTTSGRKIENQTRRKRQLKQQVTGSEPQIAGEIRNHDSLPQEAVQTGSTEKSLSRKQRQSRAKKESSLQAMLRKSKEREKQAQSGFGLGIMDFMKMGDKI